MVSGDLSFTIFTFHLTIVIVRRKKTAIFFLVFGICLIILAVALNVGWIFLNLQQVAMLVLGIIFFALIITGLVLNTIFLLREIRRNEKQDAFLNAVTHELKTPIASIKLYLETLKTRDIGKEKQQEFYDVMLADSDRLLTTVEQVLQASHTREKSRALNRSQIDIGELLRESAELVRIRYKLPDDAVTFAGIASQTFISGDLSEIKTAFGNLLDNAIKYSGDNPEVSIKTRIRQNRLIEIQIEDKGVGIPSNELKTIFKRFYRVQNASTETTKGNGLGLFIVRAIVKKHGGKISAKSRGVGKGTTFIVQLSTVENA